MTEPLPFSTGTESDPQPLEQTSLFEDSGYDPNSEIKVAKHNPIRLPSSETEECTFCSRSIDPKHESTYHQVLTWVHGVKKDSSVLREYTGLAACSSCIRKLRGGIAPTQKDLTEIMAESDESQRGAPRAGVEVDSVYADGFREGFEAGVVDKPLLTFADDKMQDPEFANGYWDGVHSAEFNQLARVNHMKEGESSDNSDNDNEVTQVTGALPS